MYANRSALLIALAVAAPSFGQAGRSFTYQGQLKENGRAAAGTYDIQARLFSAGEGGAQVGAVCLDGVQVVDGVFSVSMDFGATAFDGNDRYLELSVRADATAGNCDSGVFTVLAGRQRISPTPYAVRTLMNPSALDASDGSPVGAVNVNASGFVGIGTAAPNRLLHLAAALNPELRIQDTSATGKTYHMGVATADGSLRIAESGVADRLVITPAGLFGFNTAAPTFPISVKAKANGANENLISLRNQNDNERWLMSLNNNNLVFNDRGADRVVFHPGSGLALTVNGTTRTNVLEIVGGSDIAEPYNVTGDAEVAPGMVVCIDPERVGELRLSGGAYDTKVAGIVSGANGVNTGMTLTQTGTVADGKHPVALTGRVWCWCDASSGAITAGDLLTTSATPGHAMKASDGARAQGAVIGKAMSRLESGKGMVLVLVNLQ